MKSTHKESTVKVKRITDKRFDTQSYKPRIEHFKSKSCNQQM